MRRAIRFAALVVLAGWTGAAPAHEVRPGYLDIREVEPGVYDVTWKVPARGDMRLSLYARLPESCTGSTDTGAFTGGAFVARWRATCPDGLIGQRITIEGLPATRTDVLARVAHLAG